MVSFAIKADVAALAVRRPKETTTPQMLAREPSGLVLSSLSKKRAGPLLKNAAELSTITENRFD
jgi:hypothetical protein